MFDSVEDVAACWKCAVSAALFFRDIFQRCRCAREHALCVGVRRRREYVHVGGLWVSSPACVLWGVREPVNVECEYA